MCRMVNIVTNTGEQVPVSEYKKSQIEEMIQKAGDCTVIDQIILFGSSINMSCEEDSDIDVVIISRETVSKLSQNKRYQAYWERIYQKDHFKTEYDVLYFSSYQDIVNKKDKIPICKEIIEKGKTIYQKDGRHSA